MLKGVHSTVLMAHHEVVIEQVDDFEQGKRWDLLFVLRWVEFAIKSTKNAFVNEISQFCQHKEQLYTKNTYYFDMIEIYLKDGTAALIYIKNRVCLHCISLYLGINKEADDVKNYKDPTLVNDHIDTAPENRFIDSLDYEKNQKKYLIPTESSKPMDFSKPTKFIEPTETPKPQCQHCIDLLEETNQYSDADVDAFNIMVGDLKRNYDLIRTTVEQQLSTGHAHFSVLSDALTKSHTAALSQLKTYDKSNIAKGSLNHFIVSVIRISEEFLLNLNAVSIRFIYNEYI